MDHLGIGVEINMIDGVSIVSQNIVNSFNHVETAANDMVSKVQNKMLELDSLAHAGERLTSAGESLKSFGEKGLEGLFGLGEKVVETSGNFETLRATLQALYHDDAKGNQMFDWAVNQSMNYPMTLQQILTVMNRFQGAGLDIQHQLTDHYQALNAISDLYKGLGLSHSSGGSQMGIGRAEKAITEIADANNWREMQQGLFITKDSVEQYLSNMGMDKMNAAFNNNSGTDEAKVARLDAIMTYVELRFGNLTQKLAATWDTLKTNFIDIADVFMNSVGEGDFFKNLEQTLFTLHGLIVSHRDDMEQLGHTIGQGLADIWGVISKVIFEVYNLLAAFSEFSKTHPHLAALLIDIFAIGSSILVVVGVLLQFSGGAITALATVAQFSLALQMANITLTEFAGQMALALAETLLLFAGIAAVAFVAYEAYTNNFMGMKDAIDKFVANAKLGFQELHTLFTSTDPREIGQVWEESFSWVKDIYEMFLMLQVAYAEWTGTSVSDNTKTAIDVTGLNKTADDVRHFTDNVKEFFKGVADGIQLAWTVIGPVVEVIWNAVDSAFNLVAQFAEKLGIMTASTDPDKMHRLGEEIGFFGSIFVAGAVLVNIAKFIEMLWGSVEALGALELLLSIIQPEILLIAATIAALAIVGYEVVKNWDLIKTTIKGAWAEIKSDLTDFIGHVRSLWDNMNNLFNGVRNGFKNAPVVNPGGVPNSDGTFDKYHSVMGAPVPGAATGGFVASEGIVNLHPGEIVLNASQVEKLDGFIGALHSSQNTVNSDTDFGDLSSPVSYPTATTNNTHSTTDNSVKIGSLNLTLPMPQGVTDPREYAQQVMEELKRLQTEHDMITYNS